MIKNNLKQTSKTGLLSLDTLSQPQEEPTAIFFFICLLTDDISMNTKSKDLFTY